MGLGVGSMKNHGIKQSKLDSVVKSSGSRYTEVISFRFLGSCKELRWAELCKSSLPPACRRWLKKVVEKLWKE